MKNVIFWDTDKSERIRALKRLGELGYQQSKHTIADLVWDLSNNLTIGIDREQSVTNDTYIVRYDKPTLYNSAAEFITALEEFHQPKMRAMTKEEIVDLVAKGNLWVCNKNREDKVFLVNTLKLDSDCFLWIGGHGNYGTGYDAGYICKHFTYSTDLKTWHKFEVED